MGNKIARTTQASASDFYLHDLPSSYNLVLKEVLCRGRFFKSIQCKHDEGIVLVKVYFKRGDFIDLREYERRLIQIRDTFRTLEHPHVWPFQFWLETDKAAYLLRQYFFNNLHDRLATRPFLSFVEKKWLAFQLLHAVKQSHENGICHGDIKCENVLVTSWNWLYLSDFASFKPTYIPHDDPSDFSFFFDTGGRRLCYLAPERFVEHGNEMQVVQDALLKPSMDVFSVGCVIAELFLVGQPLFELSQLLAYRRGQYDPSQHLEKIQDSGIRKMILHMIQLDPELRLSAESYLQCYSEVVFPSYFSPFLHNFYSCLGPLIPDTRVAVCQGAFHEIHKQMRKNKHSEFTRNRQFISSNGCRTEITQYCDAKPEHESMLDFVRDGRELENAVDEFKLLDDINNLLLHVRHCGNNLHCKPTSGGVHGSLFPQSCSDSVLRFPNGGLVPSMYDIKNYTISSLQNLNLLISDVDSDCSPLNQVNMRCEDIVLIASLLCSCIRNVKLPQLRRAAVLLLKSCSFHINDEDRLQRVLPYIVGMLSDPAAIVRCAALDTLCDILSLVRDFPPSDTKIFPEYIFPMLSMLPDDPEETVRICYASNISKLALTAYRFLTYSHRSDERGINDNSQLIQLRRSIADIIQELVMGPRQTPNIRRALLQDIGKLCCFFGRRQSNDFLLPVLPAFLNDRDEQLRSVFYYQIVYVCFFVGKISVEEYLLPYIDQALGDGVEAVNVNALDCLTVLCRREFLQKRVLLEMIGRAVLLLCYPSRWVRMSAVSFVTACSASLGPVDSYVYLAPIVHPFLQRQPSSLTSDDMLLSCLKPPVSKQLFYQVLDKSRCSDMLGRQRKIWYNQSLQTKKWEAVDKVEGELCPAVTLVKEHNPQYHKPLENAMQQLDLNAHTNGMARLTAGSSPVHFHELVGSQKLQTSGVLSFIISKSSEDIPVYSFSSHYGEAGAARISSSMPWIDTPSKNFNMASSDPAPKLVSDSFRILNGSKQFVRVVHEPEIIEDCDVIHGVGTYVIDQDRNVAVGETLSNDDNGSCSFTRFPVLDSRWRPRGVLVAHLSEHRSAVNDITISADHGFFVTASDDSSVKVWDCRKLEKDISFRSRLTYSLEGARALCATTIRGSAQVVVGACDGMLHLFSVDCLKRGIGVIAGKYSGIVDVKRKDVREGAISSLSNFSSCGGAHEVLIFSTKNCGIHLWDTRTSSSAWKLKAPIEEGYVSSIVTGSCGNWFVSGSSRGFLTLWDLRFLVPINAWQYSRACVIEKMCLFVPLPNTSQSTTARPLIYVSAGCNEVSLWNAENGSCHQIFRVSANFDSDAEMSELPWALARHPSKHYSKHEINQHANPKYRGDEVTEPLPRLPGIRAMFALPGGDLLTGGTDLKIRRWDHYSPDKSYCVCGPSIKGVSNEEFYEARSSFGVQVVQEIRKPLAAARPSAKSVLAAAAVDSVGCHRDAILAMASVKLNQQLLISTSRDGAVKVWR